MHVWWQHLGALAGGAHVFIAGMIYVYIGWVCWSREENKLNAIMFIVNLRILRNII